MLLLLEEIYMSTHTTKKTSKVMCEKSIKNKNGVCNSTNKKLRKKFSQKVQETLDCFER